MSTVKGLVHLQAAGLVLAYGEPSESPHTLVCAKYGTGELIWKQTGLYTTPALAPKARKLQYAAYLLDTDHTVVLDPTEDGLLRLDLRSGQVLWRIAENGFDAGDDRVGLFAADGRIFVRYGKKLLAISQDGGNVLWTRKVKFPSPVVQFASTPEGLLVRGAFNLDGNGRPSWDPFLSLLDAVTGATKWTTEKTNFKGRSSFLREDNAIGIALEKGVATYDLASGKILSSATMPEFDGAEDPCCLQRFDGGRLLIWSSQNMRMLDQSGKPLYSLYLKAPGASLFSKLATSALLVAAGAASYAAASPGGLYYVPNLRPILTKRYKASVDAERFSFIFTETSEAEGAKFALVRIDKETGKDTGRVYFANRSPSYRLDPATGIAVVIDDLWVFAVRFDPVADVHSGSKGLPREASKPGSARRTEQ